MLSARLPSADKNLRISACLEVPGSLGKPTKFDPCLKVHALRHRKRRDGWTSVQAMHHAFWCCEHLAESTAAQQHSQRSTVNCKPWWTEACIVQIVLYYCKVRSDKKVEHLQQLALALQHTNTMMEEDRKVDWTWTRACNCHLAMCKHRYHRCLQHPGNDFSVSYMFCNQAQTSQSRIKPSIVWDKEARLSDLGCCMSRIHLTLPNKENWWQQPNSLLLSPWTPDRLCLHSWQFNQSWVPWLWCDLDCATAQWRERRPGTDGLTKNRKLEDLHRHTRRKRNKYLKHPKQCK